MDSTAPRMVPLRAAVAMVCATTAVFFAGVFAAHAWPGRAGEARSSFTVAGSLTLPAGSARPPMLRFVFHRSGAPDCAVDTRAEMPPTGDQFTAQIDYDACGRGFFDGSDVTADVLVNGAAVVTGQAVNPVPYAHFASVAGVARQYETPDCPVGYRRVEESGFPATGRLCQRFSATGSLVDVVVRVGDGASAFWIDRYEASVWSDANGSLATTLADGRVVPWGEGTRLDDYPASFPKNGLWTVPLYAVSRPNVSPSAHITWFQAAAACRSSGKRLPSGEEWLAAARGTRDSGASDGSDGTCVTVRGPLYSSATPRCASLWGAQDMIGNVWEWTSEWLANVGQITSPPQTVVGASVGGTRVNNSLAPWPTGYGDDGTVNVTSTTFSANVPGSENVMGLPAVAIRGGGPGNGVRSGVFAFSADFAPTHWNSGIGFRCVIPR